jgi:hypothetical protein
MDKLTARTKKLYCTITRNWAYCDPKRYAELAAKAGSVKKLIETHISREGVKLLAAHDNDIDKARAAALKDVPKNKVRCIVSGELLYISDERLAKKIEKFGSEEDFREQEISRVATRLRKEESAKIDSTKSFSELEPAQQKTIDAGIVAMAQAGTLPAASAVKGSKKNAPVEPKAETAPKAEKVETAPKAATTVKDTTPPTSNRKNKKAIKAAQAAADKS